MNYKPPIIPENTLVDSPFSNKKASLKYRIGSSDIFIMYGSRNYYCDIMNREKGLMYQFDLARKFKIHAILLIDKNMTISEKINLKIVVGAFGINVIREIEFDFKSEIEKKRIEKILGEIAKEITEPANHIFRWF